LPDVFAVADQLVAHAVRRHGKDIAIIAYYGSYAKGTASATSDLDLFYIPDEGKASTLCFQFVVDGLPFDIWPVSWDLATAIANARSSRPWAVSASLIADTRVLYHRSPGDLARFNGLKERIAALTSPDTRAEMLAKAADAYREVTTELGRLHLAAAEDDRASLVSGALELLNAACNCLALVSQTYFASGWGPSLPEALRLPIRPARFAELADILTSAPNEVAVLGAADALAREVRALIRSEMAAFAKPSPAHEVLAEGYPFVFEYVNKVLSACSKREAVRARYAALQLQDELAEMLSRIRNGMGGSPASQAGDHRAAYLAEDFPDLMEPAVAGDLPRLAARARDLDEHTRQWLREHSMPLNILNGIGALERFLEERDPA
jgi:hypothetical protein